MVRQRAPHPALKVTLQLNLVSRQIHTRQANGECITYLNDMAMMPPFGAEIAFFNEVAVGKAAKTDHSFRFGTG